MRHLCLYSVGVIDFTHHPPPIAPLADRAIRTAPIDQQGERPRARRQIAGNRQPDRCPSMRRRCSEADRPRPDRGSDPRPNEPVDKSREYLARSADGMGAKRSPFRQSFPHDKQLTALSKAKVEAGVRFAQTYILGRLRAQTFFSLAECNQAITLVMQRMNERPMRHLGLSRFELFEKVERDVLNALPAEDWEFAEWRRARVNLDYHIEVHDFLYSVPHALIRAEVDVRVTARTVEVFHRGQRVAVHQRRYMGSKHGTNPDHMPSSHRRYAEWTPGRFRRCAGKIGPNTEGLISAVLASRPHPEQGFRTCLGISALLSRPRYDAARGSLVPNL